VRRAAAGERRRAVRACERGEERERCALRMRASAAHGCMRASAAHDTMRASAARGRARARAPTIFSALVVPRTAMPCVVTPPCNSCTSV
jgi:hypothetical protein